MTIEEVDDYGYVVYRDEDWWTATGLIPGAHGREGSVVGRSQGCWLAIVDDHYNT